MSTRVVLLKFLDQTFDFGPSPIEEWNKSVKLFFTNISSNQYYLTHCLKTREEARDLLLRAKKIITTNKRVLSKTDIHNIIISCNNIIGFLSLAYPQKGQIFISQSRTRIVESFDNENVYFCEFENKSYGWKFKKMDFIKYNSWKSWINYNYNSIQINKCG